MAQEPLKLLCSSAKIERDRGVAALEKYLGDSTEEAVKLLELSVCNLLEDTQSPWESKHGALMGTKALVSGTTTDNATTGIADSPVWQCSLEFADAAKQHGLRLLEDEESRVRLAAGEVMGALCQRLGPDIYTTTKDVIFEGIKINLKRQPLSEAPETHTEQLVEKLSAQPGQTRQRRNSADADQIFHDTAGWKHLETWMKCLQCVVDGCCSSFNAFIDQDLLDLVFLTLTHTNRFVRETGYYVCGSLVSCNYSADGEMLMPPEENAIYHHGHQLAKQLSQGLADNWSQVRLAASVAARSFLQGLPGGDAREKFFSVLLPPLCLNRYYVAEGVRIYNQDTWKMMTHCDGSHLVEKYIVEVVEFYVSQTEADNHAVREAACACIAELASKVSNEVVGPHVPKLLDALLVCFNDESWPVRDASCVACGNFILCFPDQSRYTMPSLYPLFYENLQDNIPSVRQGAALALANVTRAYGSEAMDAILVKVREGLEGVEKQPQNTEKYSSLDKGPATYGAVKRLRDNDMELHTDKQMLKGSRGGGCMDHKFRRPSEAWELGDGCVHLVGELAQIKGAEQPVIQLLPLVSKAAGYRHYTQHIHFLETVCKQLPFIAKGLGKRPFKMYLEMFFDAIFYGLSCDNALTASAASQCLAQLGSLLGPNILRGRVEQYNPRYLDQLSANQYMQAM